MIRRIVILCLTLVFAVILFYVTLPAIHLGNPGLYLYLGAIVLFYYISINATKENILFIIKEETIPLNKSFLFLPIVVCVIGSFLLLINFVCSPVFHATSYVNRIGINQNHEFVKDVEELALDSIPVFDADTSKTIGNKTFEDAEDWDNRFYVSDSYTLINYNDSLLRIAPIEYTSYHDWSKNRKEGIKGYVSVNSTSGVAEVVSLDQGIKYTKSAYFGDNVKRKLRFKYPTHIFGEMTFEIDEEGNPYWIVPTLRYTAIGLNPDVKSVILLNAITGETTEYAVEDVPSWVDHIYYAELVTKQINHWRKYKDGFLNGLFGKSSVATTTEKYNYIAMKGSIYVYSSIASPVASTTNDGFILTNLRTKESNYYPISNVLENNAMNTVKSLESGFNVSYPLLVNISDRPTYLMNIRDNSNQIIKYALMDATDENIVSISEASLGIEATIEIYNKKQMNNSLSSDGIEDIITIKKIKNAVINGNTNYYITDTKNKKYVVDIVM